jgi:hypothetical protein
MHAEGTPFHEMDQVSALADPKESAPQLESWPSRLM